MKINVKDLVFAAVLTALGVLLPSLFHVAGWAGSVFLPMHIPVLLCGLLCGWRYGGLCGLLVPLLCSAFTGMPPLFPVGAAMMLELCAYGVLGGLLFKRYNVYVSLIGAMLGGRIISGLANLLFMGMAGNPYGMQAFLSGAFVTALPGIIIQIVIIPVLMVALTRTGVANLAHKGTKA